MERQSASSNENDVPSVRFDGWDEEKKEEHVEQQDAEHLPPWRR